MILTFTVLMIGFISGMPIAFALCLSGMAYLLLHSFSPATTLASELFSSMNSSGLLAIPYFILAAEIMSQTGATMRLINFLDSTCRHNRGGMPVVAVLATAMFSSISGSSVATAAAVGVVLIPEMVSRGYSQKMTVGLIASAGGLGILIPPSVSLVIYGMVTETSVAKLFGAGAIIGVALTIVLLVIAYYYGMKSGVPPKPRASYKERLAAFKKAWGVLLSPIIVLGGIYTGIFTPTEAAAVSCVYAIILAFAYGYRFKQLLPILSKSASTSSVIMLILAGAKLFGYVITVERVPHQMLEFITAIGFGSTEFLLVIMLLFLVMGMFLEVNSVILITMPILVGVLHILDINLIFFAMLLILSMEIAVITPPIGLNLFTISAIARIPVMSVFKGCAPFVVTFILFILAMIAIPQIEVMLSNL